MGELTTMHENGLRTMTLVLRFITGYMLHIRGRAFLNQGGGLFFGKANHNFWETERWSKRTSS